MSNRVSEFVTFLPPEPLMRRFRNEPDVKKIAEELGCSPATVYKYLNNKRKIHFRDADRYAIRLGLHPFLIWGDEWIEPSLPNLNHPRKKKPIDS